MKQHLSLKKLGKLFQAINDRPIGKLSELANLAGLSLAKDYIGADLSGEDLSQDNLKNANLSDANLSHSNLSNTNLNNANLTNADLSNADLSYAILSNADLSNANLSHANLFSAILNNTNLDNANLSHANCGSTNLLQVKNLTTANVYCTILTTATLGISQKDLLNLKQRGATIDEAKLSSAKTVSNRIITMGDGNYNERIEGNYVQGNYREGKQSHYDLQGAQFGGGLVDADTVNAHQIGGNIYNSEQQQNSEQTKIILILAANPKTTTPLRLDEEVREIDSGLQRAKKRDQFELKQKWAVRVQDVYQSLLDCKPQIVHFSGHGSGNDGLVLEDETGDARLVDTIALAGLFELFANDIECVLLNACYSEVQASAISQHIPYVIGMKKEVGDRAAIKFATGFYSALGAGESVEFSYKLGCSVIQLDGIAEHLTPVLKKKQ